MTNHVLSSLAEAQAVYRKHFAEQKECGRRKEPEAWITLEERTLAVIVYGYNETNNGPVAIAYEYGIGFQCAGIHEITAPSRNRAGNRKKKEPGRRREPMKEPLKQLHMFKAG